MRARFAIFDVDGTLLDSNELHARAWQRTLDHFGRQVPLPELRAQMGKGGDQLLPRYFRKSQLSQLGSAIEAHRSLLYRCEFFPFARPFRGVHDLFLRLRELGVGCVLASSSKRAEVDAMVERLGLSGLLLGTTSADEAARSKPAPDIFQSALAKLVAPPHRATATDCVVVGDSPYDAIAARRTGLRIAGVLCGGYPERELTAAGCFALFRDPEDLLARLDDWTLTSTRP